MAWYPIGSTPEKQAALVSGIPMWMRRPLAGWLEPLITPTGSREAKVLRVFDQKRRIPGVLYSGLMEDYGFRQLESHLNDYPSEYIQLLDFMVYTLTAAEYDSTLSDLDRILLDCGSEWKIGIRAGLAGLEKRVPEGVQEAADTAMSTPGHAGPLLSEAWHAVFGVDPKPETGYRQAVLAVEAAAIPTVIPSDPNATLGKVFAVMRDQKDWALDIKKQHKDHPSTAVLLGMVQMLWAGQGRHAGQPDWAPNTQAEAEAEAAVMLAVPLVQWFSSGAIARRP
ncbi:hypothetical protein [Microbacterium oxydans]|uniref:Uncharacterized protein n=1 Tax=Microbacterium oxydans TaxID=82380 RepID=A0A0F0L9A8_9MICO|nr:hypothetical protein [Microbacterium oxydans]KJL28156.1 hypothetical protein RS83_03224 [Microbacterium oxydans]